jgi:hypothetical protein
MLESAFVMMTALGDSRFAARCPLLADFDRPWMLHCYDGNDC